MKAVIVAAGKSTRLYPLTLDTPKPLLKINDSTIIENSMESLRKNGIQDIGVVVGYLKEQFYKILKDKVALIYNPFYAFTNDMASLWCARDFVENSSFLYLHADLVYHPNILRNCLIRQGEIVLVVEEKRCDQEDMKVRVKDSLVVESGKDIPLDDAYGEWIGIAKFSEKGGELLFSEIDKILEEEKFNVYDTYAFTKLVKQGYEINISLTEDLPWLELDYIEEFEKAKEMFREQ